jgi:hypothetical protein
MPKDSKKYIRDYAKIIKIIAGVVILFLLFVYGIFQARNLIKGPELLIISPQTGASTAEQVAHITGSAKHISFISLNGRQIFVDPQGNFNEELLLLPGYNLWTISAQDSFNRTISKKIEIMYTGTTTKPDTHTINTKPLNAPISSSTVPNSTTTSSSTTSP